MKLRIRVAAAAIVLSSSATVALATTGANASSMTKDASITVIHAIPKTPVDVYVNGKLTLKDFKFGTVAGPLSLPAATYAIAIRPYGAKATTMPILAKSVKVSAGLNATIVANLTSAGKPTITVFGNPTTPVAMGKDRLIVRHVAAAPAVDIYAGSTKLFSKVTNPHQGTVTTSAGKVTVLVDLAGTMKVAIGPAKLNLASGKTTIVYAIGSATGKDLTVALQSY